MSCTKIQDGYVCSCCVGHYEYKGYRFEETNYFGPALITKSGNIKKRQPGSRSPFWKAYYEWLKLSKKEKRKTEI